MIKNNKNNQTDLTNNQILFNLLFKSKNMYGLTFKKTNKDLIPFIYGVRDKYSIIDIKKVSIFFIRTFKLIKNILKRNHKMLIIGNAEDIIFLGNQNYIKKNKNIIFFNKEWVNGLITNKIKNDKLNTQFNNTLKKNQIKLVFIIKSSVDENYLTTELASLKIPTISFLSTDKNLKNINYPLLSNLNNIQSVHTLMYLLRKLF